MYDHIEGELVSKSPAQAVIAAGGVGYSFTIPISTFAALPDRGRAKLLAYLHVREDVLRLFGFASEKERKLFVRLISVSGIGPGTALAILNGLTVDEFRRAVAAEEVSTLCRVKGIGRKTAERMIVELRREMERELLEEPEARGRRRTSPPTPSRRCSPWATRAPPPRRPCCAPWKNSAATRTSNGSSAQALQEV